MRIPALLQSRLSLITPRLIKKKPEFLVRAFFRLLLQRFFNKEGIRAVLFHTHYKCNLDCKHCYEKNFWGELPIDLAVKADRADTVAILERYPSKGTCCSCWPW